MKTILKTLTALVIISSVQSCAKSDSSTPAATTTTPAAPSPTFSCIVDGATFTPTSITGAKGSSYTITALYTSVSVTSQIVIFLSSTSIGTYQLTNDYGYLGGSNGATYSTGSNINAMTQFYPDGTSPYVGTCIITSSSNNVISGTFNFTGGTYGYTTPSHTIASGSFSNITL